MYRKNCGHEMIDNAAVCLDGGVQIGEPKSSKKVPNVIGIVGFVLAVVATFFCLLGFLAGYLFFIALSLGIAAIVCSALGIRNAKQKNAQYRGLSIAGLVVGIAIASFVIVWLTFTITVLLVYMS